MSLLNAWIEPGRALVAVDTTSYDITSGAPSERSKLIPLAHANAVIATRGINKLLLEVFAAIFVMPVSVDYDVISDWLPSALDSGFEGYVANCLAVGMDEGLVREVELAVVGWSQRSGEMAGVRLTRSPGDSSFSVKPIRPWSIAPNAGWGASTPPPAPSTIEAMEEVARAQVRHIRETYSGDPIGGRLIVAELTRDQMTIRSIANLG